MQKNLSLIISLFTFLVISCTLPSKIAAYKPIDPATLGSEIDNFFSQGATGYLVWQYSGDLHGSHFENDEYSFFRDDGPGKQICATLKSKSTTPGKFVGVNIWSAGKYPANVLQDHFSWLKNNCGVSVIRIFAKEAAGGPNGVVNALYAAGKTGVKLIVAIGDYSNGGGGMPLGANKAWYAGGYVNDYLPYMKEVLAKTRGNGSLFGYELANEPHCNGDGTAIDAYTSWVNDVSSILRSGSGKVGIGQMASQSKNHCDAPASEFAQTNAASTITMTSAHYYNASEKENGLQALAESKKLGKMFYIGEASLGDSSDGGGGGDGSGGSGSGGGSGDWEGPFIGTHLIQGDPGGQEKVVEKLISDGAPEKYPVVVMLDAESAGSYAGLLGKIKSAGFSPIIRVNIKVGTPTSAMAQVASVLSAVPDAPVTLGNEIETRTEWDSTDYSHYGELFDALAAVLPSSHPLGISTFNTSNADVDVATLIPKVLATISQKGKITAVFSNSYDLTCGYPEAGRCTAKGTGAWVLGKINSALGTSISAKTKLYITEFGTLNCGDYDCLQKFYEDNKNVEAALVVGFTREPGQTQGSNWIHTAPVLCRYYKLGSLEAIYPTKCGAGKSLYIYRGIDDQPNTGAKIAMATTYMMTCANNLKFGGDVSVSAEPYSGAPCPDSQACVVAAAATAYINHSATTIPLFRLQGAKAPRSTKGRRTDDLEGFFGGASPELAKAASINEQFTQPLKSGTNRKSTGAVEQCIRTVNFLKSIQDLCDHEPPKASPINPLPSPLVKKKTADVGRCALDLSVPSFESDTEKKNRYYTDVLREVNAINSDTQAFCNIAPPSDPRVWRDQDAKLSFVRELLHRVEIITPKAFKPAYIVRYITSPKLDPGGASALDRYIAWFAPATPASASAVKNRIVVSKVFVPANIATADTSGTQNFSSNLIQAISPFLSLDTINLIKKNRDTFEYPAITGAMNRDIIGGAKDYDPQTGSDIVCPECTDPDALETILAKKINADIAFKKGAATLNPYYATLFADEQDLDCTASDITGEKAETKKMTINPTGSGDEVDEIALAAKALLRYKAGNSHDNLEARTYLLLPEEYRNIRDYEVPFTSSLFAYKGITQPSYVMTSPAPLPSGQTEWAYKYLQMGDTKAKSGNGLSIDISSPESKHIGYTRGGLDPITGVPGKPTPVYVTGKIVGPELSTFNINPLVPGGKLTRGLWEIMCHILQPYDPKRAYAPYEGFEKFLTKGVASCYTDKAPTQCVPGSDQSPQPVMSQIGNGFLVVAPTKTKLITTTALELGKKTCDWAGSLGDKQPAFSINANFFKGTTSRPIGPYGSDGLIIDAPIISGVNVMSLMVDKNGNAHVYDWDNRSGQKADKTGKPDLSQANFIVSGVYYDNFQGTEAFPAPRTVLGLKDNSLYIRSLVASPDGVKQAMSDLGIDEGHFVMLDGGPSSQLCQGSKLLYPVGPAYESVGYPQAVSVSMGVGGKSATDDGCVSPTPAPMSTLSQYFNEVETLRSTHIPKNPTPPGACGLVYVTPEQAKTYAAIIKPSFDSGAQQKGTPGKFAGWGKYFAGYFPSQEQKLFGKCGDKGQNCYDFVMDIVNNTPICNANTRLNPLVALAIALNETGGLRDLPGTTANEHFGCSMSIFSEYKDGGSAKSADGLQCTVKTADGRQVINGLIGPPLTTGDVAVCIPDSAQPTWMLSRKKTTVEDGLACMVARFNSYCKPSSGAKNDVDALHAYGYVKLENIYNTVMRYLLINNPDVFNAISAQCSAQLQ